MKTVSVSSNKFNNLEKFDLSDINTEGQIFKFPYRGTVKILKKLYVSDGITLAKKLFTIEVLNSNDLPSYFVVPDSLVSVNNNVVGFTIPFINGITLKSFLDNDQFSFDLKIKYLKDIGNILDDMVNIRKYNPELRHFYLNDMHESNFMVNYDNGKLCSIDLDGCKINSSFSFPARYLTNKGLFNCVNKYNVEPDMRHGSYVMANRDSDLYCYVIMILNYLYGSNIGSINLSSYYEYLNYLESIGISKELLDSFFRIVSYGENINPNIYLDSLTSEQVCRAKENVYRIIKNKKTL